MKKKEMTLADYFNELEKRAKEIEKTNRYNGDGKAIGCILEAGFRMFMED